MYYLELAGEDDRFAIAEASLACESVEALAPGVATAETVDQQLAARLAQTRQILTAVTHVEGDLESLITSLQSAPLNGRDNVAVRATAVRGAVEIDSPKIERTVGHVLVEQGCTVELDDPDRVFRILATGGSPITWYGGWVAIKPERSYGARRPPKRPFRQPGTMRPQLARTLVNLSGVTTGEVLLDPMCGPGAILIEAALVDARPVGIDVQQQMVEGARRNVRAFTEEKTDSLYIRGSAASMPVCQADVAVFDAPYGRQSPIGFESAPELVEATLAQLEDVVDRCVVVFDQPVGDVTDSGWRVSDQFTQRVHRSLTRHVFVLEPRL